MRQQCLQTLVIAAQGAGIEHGLRRLIADQLRHLLGERAESRRREADHQAGVGTELAAALHHRGSQLAGHGLRARLQGLGQHDDRVDARHLGEHRDRLRACRRHVAQGAPALERAGKADRLDRRMLDQRLTDAATEDHVEHARRHFGGLGRTNDRIGDALGRGHMPAVGLEHHRATGRQRGGGIPARRGKRQGEVARAKHGDGAQADAVLAQVRAWQRLAIRQCLVDARAIEITTAQHRREQTHLPAGAAALAFDTGSGQRGFTADPLDKIIAQRVQLIGDRLQELRAARCTQGAVRRVSRRRRLGSGVDFLRGRLVESLGQGFAGRCIDALQLEVAVGAALAADEVVAKELGHVALL